MQGLGQSKKVQDIQKQLDMSLDDLIKSKPKKAAAGGAKPKQAPKLLVKPAAATRNGKATGVAAKRMEIKARKAAGAALKGIANKRAPTTLGVAKRGVTKAGARGAGAVAKGGAAVIKRTARGTSVAPAKTSLARKIVSRARTAKAKQQQAPKTLVAAAASKQQGKKAKNKIPAPKFTVAAPQPKQQQHQQQQRKGSTATKMAAQRQQQQQQQQGRRSKQPIQAPQQQGRNLNRTAAGGVRKPSQAPKFQNQSYQQQQGQGQRRQQQRQGQGMGQGRAPMSVAPRGMAQGSGRGGRRQQQQRQAAYQQWAPAPSAGQGRKGKNPRAPLSVAGSASGMPLQYAYAQAPVQYGQQQYMMPAQAAAAYPAGQMFMDPASGMTYTYASDPSAAYGIQAAWPSQQPIDNRPAIARRNRSRS